MANSLEQADRLTVKNLAPVGDSSQRLLGEEHQGDVGAHCGQETHSGCCGDYVGGPYCLQDVNT